VVLTGGPSAGKSAVLETLLRTLCPHLAVLPEAASIVFGGGFPREASLAGRRAAQRAIFHVQREVERFVTEQGAVAVGLCDRGTLDGLAYWPDGDASWFEHMNTTRAAELARYRAVIHLRTPGADQGYDTSNALRVESAHEAAAIDARISTAWAEHPRRSVVENTDDFLHKVARAVELVRQELPSCCRAHVALAGSPAEACEPDA
jgi:hypothetical protein